MEDLVTDASIPPKGHHAHHKLLTLQHTNGVPDREDVTALSDSELIIRLGIQAEAKPIPSDAAHTTHSAHPIPTLPANPGGKFFPSHASKI
jgi:hypothetical protein